MSVGVCPQYHLSTCRLQMRECVFTRKNLFGENKHGMWPSRKHFASLSRSASSLSRHTSGIGPYRRGMSKPVCQASPEMDSTYTWPNNQKPRVCILGGGFGGLYTALRLESLIWSSDKKPQVLLVDQSERFVFKPLLYELLSGEVDPWEIAPLFKDLISNTSIRFLQDKVKLLQPSDQLSREDKKGSNSGGRIYLESGMVVEYDWSWKMHLSWKQNF